MDQTTKCRTCGSRDASCDCGQCVRCCNAQHMETHHRCRRCGQPTVRALCAECLVWIEFEAEMRVSNLVRWALSPDTARSRP